MGVSVRSVARYLAELREHKLIETTRRGDGDTSIHTFLAEPFESLLSDEPDALEEPISDSPKLPVSEVTESSLLNSEGTDMVFRRDENGAPIKSIGILSTNLATDTSFSQEIDRESPIAEFTTKAYRSVGKRAKVTNLRTARSAAPGGECSRLEQGETRYGRAEFRRGILAYLDTEDDYLRQRRWPLWFFLKHPDWYVPRDSPPVRKPRLAPIESVVPSMSEDTVIPNSPHDLVNRWNAALPEAECIWHETYNENEPIKDPKLVERFDKLLAKGRAVLDAGDTESSWYVDLPWLLSPSKTGPPNWYSWIQRRHKPKKERAANVVSDAAARYLARQEQKKLMEVQQKKLMEAGNE